MIALWRVVAICGLTFLFSPVASAEATVQLHRFNWRSQLGAVTHYLESPGKLNPQNCAAVIDGFADRLERLPSDAFAPHDADEAAAVAADAPKAFEGFFKVRLLLKKRLDSFAAPSKACVDAIRRGLRVARFAEDYLADWLHAQGKDQEQSSRLFGGGAAQVAVNPAFRSAEVRTGDLLLMRGPAFVSALIARSGDEEGDFSHLAIVGEDSTGRQYVVEALIAKGVITTPLDQYLEGKEEGRVVLLRYRDPRIAAVAGRMIYDLAQAAIDSGTPIRYNFRLDRRDNARLFCAQVIAYAYQLATHGRVNLPRYTSTLSRLKQTPVYSALGITSDQTFAPSDIQLDPRFKVVAEYRNANYLRKMRHDNVVLTKLLEWMRRGYSIRPNPFSDFIASYILRVVGREEVNEDSGLPDKESVALLVGLGRTASKLGDAVSTIDARAEAATGHPMTYRELAREVEDLRLKACGSAGEASVVQELMVAPSGACGVASR